MESIRFSGPSSSQAIQIQPDNKDKAALIVQKYFRGYLVRRSCLSRDLHQKITAFYKKNEESDASSIPQATFGKTPVYLPTEMPDIVLKHSGREKGIERLDGMQKVKSILISQNSTHLIIPKAYLFGAFLVERKLPINVDTLHNMELYLSSTRLFDEPVRELVRLFSRVYLSDLVSSQLSPLSRIPDVEDTVRYDNLPMYVVEENGEKKGRIGLIDLEHIAYSPDPKGLETLVRIFPLHVDIIKEEALKYSLEYDETLLKTSAEKGKKYLKVGFTDHLEWLKQKGISTQTPSGHFEITDERIGELKSCVQKEWIRLNEGVNDVMSKRQVSDTPIKNFLIGDSEKVSRELAETITPMIIENIKLELEKNLQQIQPSSLTESELVKFRSFLTERSKIYAGVQKLISGNKKVEFKDDAYFQKSSIIEQLMNVIMEELVKNGEIFYYDPAYYTQGHELCWIRF